MCEWSTKVGKIKEFVVLRSFIDVLHSSDLAIPEGVFIFVMRISSCLIINDLCLIYPCLPC